MIFRAPSSKTDFLAQNSVVFARRGHATDVLYGINVFSMTEQDYLTINVAKQRFVIISNQKCKILYSIFMVFFCQIVDRVTKIEMT